MEGACIAIGFKERTNSLDAIAATAGARMTIHTAIKIPLTMPVHPVVVRYTEPGGAVTYEVMDRSAVGNSGTVSKGEELESNGTTTGTIFAFGEK